MTTPVRTSTREQGVARVEWDADAGPDQVRSVVETALAAYDRVEAHVGVDDETGQRTATRSGLRREGVRRAATGDQVVYARLAADPPVTEGEGFRALLNSFLPRKRAIAQALLRDEQSRVLLCRLTYKRDWDLPGGVVEVGESPGQGMVREVAEELAVTVTPGRLLLADWLPPWSGWDDAVCFVFDAGAHPADLLARVVREEREIAEVAFCTPVEVRALAADFTARRVEAALLALDGGPTYAESGHVDHDQ